MAARNNFPAPESLTHHVGVRSCKSGRHLRVSIGPSLLAESDTVQHGFFEVILAKPNFDDSAGALVHQTLNAASGYAPNDRPSWEGFLG